jgi:hypothetical protein
VVKQREVTVRARDLYFAADPKASSKPAPNAAAAALGGLMPRDDFALQMNLVPQFSEDGSPQVRVLLGVDSRAAGKLDVLIRAYDRVFTPVGTPLKQRLDVPASAVAGSAAFQWTSVITTPPGDYEVRAAVATADGTRAASVIGYTDVPDVRKEGLALSGIVVKSAGTPTIRRTFAAGESIALAFQLARARTNTATTSVRYVLSDDLGQPVTSREIPPASAGANGIEAHELAVRLPGVAGRYVARVEASDGRRSVKREVPFVVR